MSAAGKTAVTFVLLLALAGLGATDVYLSGGKLPVALQPQKSDSGATLPGSPVAKKKGPNVLDVIVTQGFTAEATPEESLIQQVLPPGTPVLYRTLLKGSDRAGYVVWIDSPAAKTAFAALKEALARSFSNQLQNLSDRTQQLPGQPVANIVSFSDPRISTEKIVLARVQERVYELHEAPGSEDALDGLLQKLISR